MESVSVFDPVGLAARLKAARSKAGLTQAEAAHGAEVDASSLSRWERGKTGDVGVAGLHRLAALYKVRAGWLVDGIGDRDSDAESRLEPDDSTSYPVVEAYITDPTNMVSLDHARELRSWRRSDGAKDVSLYEVRALHNGLIARDAGKRMHRPPLVDDNE